MAARSGRFLSAPMLRSFSPRRKFSFDLALHKSKEKKKDKTSDDQGFAAIVDGLNQSEEPRGRQPSSRKGSFFRSSRDDGGGGRREPSARGSSPEPTRQSWLRMREAPPARGEPQVFEPARPSPAPTLFLEGAGAGAAAASALALFRVLSRDAPPIRRPSESERQRQPKDREERREEARARGRRSARGDDSPRIRELSREGSRVRRQQQQQQQQDQQKAAAEANNVVAPPPAPPRQAHPARAASADSRGRQAQPAAAATAASSAGDLARPAKAKKPVVMTDPPSWHELKTRALEADFAAIDRFVADNGGFTSDESQRTREPPTPDDGAERERVIRRPFNVNGPESKAWHALGSPRETIASGNRWRYEGLFKSWSQRLRSRPGSTTGSVFASPRTT